MCFALVTRRYVDLPLCCEYENSFHVGGFIVRRPWRGRHVPAGHAKHGVLFYRRYIFRPVKSGLGIQDHEPPQDRAAYPTFP